MWGRCVEVRSLAQAVALVGWGLVWAGIAEATTGTSGSMGVAVPASSATPTASQTSAATPLRALPQLDIAPYMGRWYQWAFYPNRFQKQCASDTQAQYRWLPSGGVEVINRCKTADGRWDEALGLARPVSGSSQEANGVLRPARLEVSFVPVWLRSLGIGWGAYWVLDRPEHGRYAIVGEPQRQYLWVLTRQPQLDASDVGQVMQRVQELGFDLQRLQRHPHTDESRER